MIATSYRHIVRRAGARSGHAIVEGTRVGVHDVVALIKTGASVDAVVASLPRLTRAQVYECLAYYEDHRAELDPLVAGQIEHLDEVDHSESSPDPPSGMPASPAIGGEGG